MLSILLPSSVALAGNCNGSGNLNFLGVTSNGNSSVWLSKTSAGSFNLVAAQGTQTVDTWSKNRSGLHLSLSSNVSNQNGGTHKLNSLDPSGNCLLDSQNQQGGFTFPSDLIPPGATRPPIGPPLTPITPMLPGGVVPPIGQAPTAPNPITPTLPGGTAPPIGTTPIDPITPTLPGATSPPIGVIPGTPITPTRPSRPPKISLPIGTVPIDPITPSVPGGTAPPIGTNPIDPITPTVPGGVTPPIGQTPTAPNPITPMLPGDVTPPIGAIPPPGESVSPPSTNNVNPTNVKAVKVSTTGVCPEDRFPVINASGEIIGCATQTYFSEKPLTEGRNLVETNPWNIWINTNYSNISDQRNNTDIRGKTYALSLGMDRLVNHSFSTGVQISGTRSMSHGFQGDLNSSTSGFLVGPYASYRLNSTWSLYGSFGIGEQTNTIQISSLQGTSKSTQYNFTFQAEGQYPISETVFVRPRAQVSQTKVNANNSLLNGTIDNTAVTLNVANEASKFGMIQSAIEFNKLLSFNSTYVMPYLEASIFYQYARPQGGQILTSNLTYVDTSPWGGGARIGARALISRTTMAKIEFNYQSIGISNLHIWGLQAMISHSF